jgi:ketosteroid isomerase-like protein
LPATAIQEEGMTRSIAAVALLALAACAPKPETPEHMAARMKAESDSARPALQAALDQFARHFAAGQADSLAMFYTDDAVVMNPDMPALRGRAAIQAADAEVMSWGTWQATFTTTRVDANGPLAVQQYTCDVSFKPGPHAPPGMTAFTYTGKTMTAYRKVNGAWLAFADIACQSDRALPAPAPAGKKH